MMNSILNHTYRAKTVAKRFGAMLLFLTLLVGLTSPTMAQALEPDHLPIIIKNGAANSPTGPYAQMLQKVQQRCAATGLNQVCYVNGQVTLQTKIGTVAFSQPGAIADLANVQSLSLTSSGPDSQQWGIAWLRLRANSITPDQGLTILAFGNVQISNIALFTSQADLENEVTLPSLQFASSPVAGVTKLGSSGLIVTNPTDEDLLSLTLNGAAITLGSTALVEAQPGDKMTVTMATGTSLTESNGQSGAAIQNQRVSLPLNQNGQTSGSPTPASSLTDDEIVEQFMKGYFQPFIDEKKLVNSALVRLDRAIDRCIEGRAAYVYNVLYWTRVIETHPFFKAQLDPAQLAQAYNRAPNCLSFEVDFDSSVNTTAPVLYQSSHVHTEGLPVRFLVDGSFCALNTSLDYPSYVYNPSQSCGSINTQNLPGELEMAAGSLKIAGNKVRIAMTLRVAKQPTDTATLNCPPAPPLVLSQNHWVSVFYHMHEDLWQKPDPSFRFNDWKYTGGEHFGEAIYERTSKGDFTFDTTTYLILVHTPLS